MELGVPRERRRGERRVAATPDSVRKLVASGFKVLIERGAGAGAGYADADYEAAGAALTDNAFDAAIVVKIRPPEPAEVEKLRVGGVLISLLQPERHPELPQLLAAKKVSAVALERIPRITRAQKMDVLSSMANLSGYRAVIEAAASFGGFLGPQVTAAGTSPPAKVLIIGAGVAGLAALGTARALGAEVRAFDTRAAAREQVESLGGRFLEVTVKESGEGQGGYGKVMSPEFIAAEMALFEAQAREVDVIITTALVPGTKAPVLVPQKVVEALKPGSIVVDLAAEQGGNCELTKPDEVVEHNGVKILGHTDLLSRMAPSASRLFSNNVVHLLEEMGGGKAFTVNLQSDVVRPALLTHDGDVLPPPPKVEPTAVPAAPRPAAPKPVPPEVKAAKAKIRDPVRRPWGTTVGSLLLVGGLFLLGRFAPGDFLQHFTVFILACFVGWQVVWAVTPALHTPLMAVTNAISGIIIIGGMLQIGSSIDVATLLGGAAVLIAAINVAGGFLVTRRMLKMFHREGGS
ncbi:MAG: Re/Si-specific NAD(P)(+) transhydrogenase subunit alpha [Myxococcaceae bacterium]|nr:Re/Si-specific NAD(P)(+) transhydrogenase subunit alpha [Myxococcaceae bacterium]